MRFKCRASSASNLMKNPQKKSEQLSESAKSVIVAKALKDIYGYQKELDVKQINKGKECEDLAIRAVGLITGTMPKKNSEQLENEWTTGECDLLLPKQIRDTKCSWSIDSFPWTIADAEKKVKQYGYDWQGQVYMELWDIDEHVVDFVLLPTPEHMLGRNDDHYEHIGLVNSIPLKKRIKSVVIKRDREKYQLLKERVELSQQYYQEVLAEMIEWTYVVKKQLYVC